MFITRSLTVDAVILILHNPNLLSPWKLDNATVFYTIEYLKLKAVDEIVEAICETLTNKRLT